MPDDLTLVPTSDLLRRLSALPTPDDIGDVVAELIRRHRGTAYAFALRLCHGNRDLADDVFQETFIRMFPWLRANGSRVRDDGFLKLLFVFVRRAAIDMIRRESRHFPTATEQEALQVASASSAPASDAREDLNRLLAKLEPRARLVLDLSLGDMNANEIGELLQLSPSHVRLLRHRAILSLRAQVAASDTEIAEGV